MKITTSQLRKIIREEVAAISLGGGKDPNRFLHGSESGHPHDDEGYMVKSRLYSLKKMAHDICELTQPEDQFPGWVQDHISVAHENLQQVHGYLTGDEALRSYSMKKPGMAESVLRESHSRITREEKEAWLRGEWGFESEDGIED